MLNQSNCASYAQTLPEFNQAFVSLSREDYANLLDALDIYGAAIEKRIEILTSNVFDAGTIIDQHKYVLASIYTTKKNVSKIFSHE